MPSRTLRESLAASDKVAAMAPGPQDRFPRYFLAADDFGCFRLQPEVIKGRIYARRPDMTPEAVAADLLEFERVGCLLTWSVAGKTFGWFTGWWEHNRQPRHDSTRKTPIPPDINALAKSERPSTEPSAAEPLRPAADPRPQFAVRSSQFVHAQLPPVSPPEKPGGPSPNVVPIRNSTTPELVRLPKRRRAAVLSLAEEARLARDMERDRRSKLLRDWVKRERDPGWDEAAGAEVPGRNPTRDEQLAWVQENCHASPEEAADAVALLEIAEKQTRVHGAS